MSEAKNGDRVVVNYTGKLKDGTVFDSSRSREPIEFVIGDRRLVPGFEDAVIGMSPGESKTAQIAPDDAYGQYRNELVAKVGRAQIPDDIDISVGQRLSLRAPDDRELPVIVTDVTEQEVTLDANHPLAGKTLTFDLELMEIK